MSSADPFCFVVVGAPGTGKSSQIRIQLSERSRPRRLIFDPMSEYQGDAGHLVGSLSALQLQLGKAGKGPFSLVYRPGTDDPKLLKARFDVWCKLAFAVGDLDVVIDEAADVTDPNRYLVPVGWSTMMRQGRHRNIGIIAATQRPADIDKRLWSFATRIRTGRLNYAGDQRQLADVLNVELAEVAGLIERQWIERDMRTGQVTRGSLEWRRSRPVDMPRAAVEVKKITSKPARPARSNGKVRNG